MPSDPKRPLTREGYDGWSRRQVQAYFDHVTSRSAREATRFQDFVADRLGIELSLPSTRRTFAAFVTVLAHLVSDETGELVDGYARSDELPIPPPTAHADDFLGHAAWFRDGASAWYAEALLGADESHVWTLDPKKGYDTSNLPVIQVGEGFVVPPRSVGGMLARLRRGSTVEQIVELNSNVYPLDSE